MLKTHTALSASDVAAFRHQGYSTQVNRAGRERYTPANTPKGH